LNQIIKMYIQHSLW